MNVTRMLLFIVGGALMIVAVGMLFFETGLNQWVSAGVALAGLLLLVGLLIVGVSDRTRGDDDIREGDRRGGDRVTVVRK